MTHNRRDFLKKAGLFGMGIAGGGIFGKLTSASNLSDSDISSVMANLNSSKNNASIIGPYGQWAAALNDTRLPLFSYRRGKWREIESWKEVANGRYMERLAMPDVGGTPGVKVKSRYIYDDLQIEELNWQLPYGRPTEAFLLKPRNAKGKLPGILAFHDHGGNKYLGRQKITRISDNLPAMVESHQQQYYGDLAWANEVAKRGYVVLVPDAFTFGSRRVLMKDVPEHLRNSLSDPEITDLEGIEAYNDWAGQHEHIMAKSLFSAGTTWPGVFLAEDKKALEILAARNDVDEERLGCGGLSGGGLRTVMMGGDPRIKCAVCVGFMTTWNDLVLNKSYTHTWMTYVPLLPNELAFPEILGLNAPQATLVLNNTDDQLFTLSEMEQADKVLQDIYRKAGVSEHYRGSFHSGPHKFDKAMQTEAFDWFDRWLKT